MQIRKFAKLCKSGLSSSTSYKGIKMSTPSKIGLVVLVSAGLVMGTGILAVRYILQLPMYVKREIAHDVLVSSDWTELKSDSPMKIVRKFQSVELRIDGAYMNTGKDDHNVYLPDGTAVNPEVQIADSDGNWYELKGGRYTVQSRGDASNIMDVGTAGFAVSGAELPKDRTYNSIRIRSTVQFKCKSIIWQNYNLK
jgi:hypothetical protein